MNCTHIKCEKTFKRHVKSACEASRFLSLTGNMPYQVPSRLRHFFKHYKNPSPNGKKPIRRSNSIPSAGKPVRLMAIVNNHKYNHMRKVKFGQSYLQVSPISFGGNVFGWTLDAKKSFEILDALVASGINFIDTADTYSTWVPGNQGGESEIIIGKWMKERGNRKD